MDPQQLTIMAHKFQSVLDADVLNARGQALGLCDRHRLITPFRFGLSIVASMATKPVLKSSYGNPRLPVPPDFPHRMAAIVAFDPDIGTPALHFAGHRGHGEHAPTAAGKQIAVVVGQEAIPVTGEIVPDRLDGGAVERDHPIRARLGLFEVQGISHLQVADLADPDGEQFVGSVSRVDPQGEQAQIPRLGAQTAFDHLDGLFGADRFDLDTRAGRWVVRIVPFL